MNSKKSQIAMESILLYGLVILVVTLAIGALVYFGVLDLGRFLPDSCSIAGEGLICENFVVKKSGSDNVQLELRNKAGKNIEGLKLTIVGEEDMTGMWGCPTLDSIASGVSIPNGVLSNPIKLTCAATGTTPSGLGIPVGKKIKGRIDVQYRIVGSAITRTETGTIQATVAP